MKTFVGVKLPDELAEALRERAERNNRTIAGELREILGAAIKRPVTGGAAGEACHV